MAAKLGTHPSEIEELAELAESKQDARRAAATGARAAQPIPAAEEARA